MIDKNKKLIRDNVPQIIIDSGRMPITRELYETEFLFEAKQKLVEEANEVLDAKSHEELIEELADVLEVVYTIAAVENITKEEIENTRVLKNKNKGMFKKRIFLDSVKR